MILNFQRQQTIAGPPAFFFYDVDILTFLPVEPPTPPPALPWIEDVDTKLSSPSAVVYIKAAD